MTRWGEAKRQARRIAEAKTDAGRSRAALTWCRKVKAALGGRTHG